MIAPFVAGRAARRRSRVPHDARSRSCSGAYLWQLLPQRARAAPRRGWPASPRSSLAAAARPSLLRRRCSGPVVERLFFAGDIARWLDGRARRAPSAAGCFLLLPACARLAACPRVARSSSTRGCAGDPPRWSRGALRAIVGPRCASAVAGRGGDARRRSALACSGAARLRSARRHRRHLRAAQRPGRRLRDGLRDHPDHLHAGRGRALAACPRTCARARSAPGRRPGRPRSRIVIPTAMSGLFSAVMIGLGRAVGETMIVLMAAGQHADHGLEHLQRLPHALGQHRRRAARGRARTARTTATLFLAALRAVRHDLRASTRWPRSCASASARGRTSCERARLDTARRPPRRPARGVA